MKIRIVEVEADKKELKASSTLGASILLKNLFMGLNGNSYEEDEEAEDTEDE